MAYACIIFLRNSQLYMTMTLNLSTLFSLLVMMVPSSSPQSTTTASLTGRVCACYLSYGVPPERVPADLCTHLLAVYSRITADGLIELQKPDDGDRLATLTSLRRQNPQLKVLLTVVGASDHFARAAASQPARDRFAGSAVALLDALSLDGLDVNWEFPAFPPWRRAGRERRHQTLLLETLSARLHAMTPRRLLAVAVGAPPTVVSAAYEVPAVAAAADLVSIMAYDLHFYQSITPFTGHNAPLRAGRWELGYFAQLNTAAVARNWLARGLPRHKMLLGIPTYGRSWKLLTSAWNGLGAPAVGQWAGGFSSYRDVCALLRAGGTRRWDARAHVPYAVRGRQWISYDDRRSVAEKAALVGALGVAGAMVFVLDSDDWAGDCGEGEYPLVNAVRRQLDAQTGGGGGD